ncbi:MAG: hypothetical protein KAH93_01780 [Candidatus Aenigmarchaeota archaeon]|nr:hypothetical protein [Candidatus Aenigmarchaeota archaeon]
MKIIDTTPITFNEAKDILTKMEKENIENEKDLGYEQKITLEYLRTRTILSKKDIKSTTEELSKIEGLKEHQRLALLNLLPKDEEEINTLFMKERVKLEKEKITQIAKIISKVRPKEKKK